jgi:alkylated DNA repair dioxygenase AlkB
LLDGKWCCVLDSEEQRLELNRGSVAVMRGGERKGMYCHVGVPTHITIVSYTKTINFL